MKVHSWVDAKRGRYTASRDQLLTLGDILQVPRLLTSADSHIWGDVGYAEWPDTASVRGGGQLTSGASAIRTCGIGSWPRIGPGYAF